MKLLVLMSIPLLCSCYSIKESDTGCYGISKHQASIRASEELASDLDRGSRWVGVPEDVVRSLSPTAVELLQYERGDGLSYAKVEFTSQRADGSLYAFIYEDCSVEWSPQFN
mgnify:CR=1 FL=1